MFSETERTYRCWDRPIVDDMANMDHYQLHKFKKNGLLLLEWRIARSSFLFESLEGAEAFPRSVRGCQASSPASPYWKPVPLEQIATGDYCHSSYCYSDPDKSVIFKTNSVVKSPIRYC